MLKLSFSFLFLLFVLFVHGQEHFLVEFEAFSPPEKEMIGNLKGFPAEAFLAKDLDGKEHFLHDYRGKNVLLFFYSVVDPISYDWLTKLNLIQIQYLEELQVFGFAEEERSIINSAMSDNAIVFPNFPNGTKFGEMAYAGDLGLGRMIVIDKDGIVKEVLPRSFFESSNSESLMPKVDKVLTQIFYR